MNCGAPHATSLVELLAAEQRPGMRGAEIGVLRGYLSEALLRHVPELFLWMVDSWTEADRESAYYRSGDTAARLSQAEHLTNLQHAFEKTAFAATRRLIVRAAAAVAAQGITDASLDFAFIDADHTYPSVRDDIRCWWPKIRAGGILAGHDYGSHANRQGRWGVNRAVDEFVQAAGLELQLRPGRVWWVRKQAQILGSLGVTEPCQAIRVVFGSIATNDRLRRSIKRALRDDWARQEVVHVVAGKANADWLLSHGARQVELAATDGLLPECERFGAWYMRAYLLLKAMQHFTEVLLLDFDCQLQRRPDQAMWQALRGLSTRRLGGTLQAPNVCFRRPVCITIYRDSRIHPVRRCLSPSVLYCRDRFWISEWLAAYEDAERRGVSSKDFNDKALLMHSLDKRLGVLDAAAMVAEFETPIAWTWRGTPEANIGKSRSQAYFVHR